MALIPISTPKMLWANFATRTFVGRILSVTTALLMIHALLFDLDNTLLDRQAAHHRWAQVYIDSLYPDADSSTKEGWVRELDEQDHFGYVSREDYGDWVIDRFPAYDQDRKTFLLEYRRTLIPLYEIDERVREMVIELSERYRVAIVSNGSTFSQRGKLRHTNLDAQFEHVVLSGELGVSKPNSQPFLEGLRLVNCDPEHSLYIGDDPVNDILGASQFGMKTCWISQGRKFPDQVAANPDFVIDSILELPECLGR
jgi:putative hydrolase of the HAD superfamily